MADKYIFFKIFIFRVKKRKYTKINYINSGMDLKFELTKNNYVMVKTLILFTSLEKSHCYQYRWSSRRQKFYCFRCRTQTFLFNVIIDIDDATGNLCVKWEDKEHLCPEIPYNPSKFTEGKLLQKPNYEILEQINSKSGRLLIIFNSENKNECHEFRCTNGRQFFYCTRCRMTAKIYNENLKSEYLELKNNAIHDCPMISFEKEKYYQFKRFIQPGDFEIQKLTKNGKEKKCIIIYANNEKTEFYKYVYSLEQNVFFVAF